MGFVAPPEMARPLTVAALIGLASVAPTRLPADEPSLKDVVRRMSAYAETYGEKASIVVATERYTQDVNGSRPPLMDHRVTVADFAIVKARGPYGEWVGFRDVVEVDGARITDRGDRLIQLLTAWAGSMAGARRLADESARFNIGPFLRNINVPTTALFFFRPGNLRRLK